jgi:hypothetical protein
MKNDTLSEESKNDLLNFIIDMHDNLKINIVKKH